MRGDIKIVLQIENGDFTALQYTVSLENVLDISIEPYKTLLSFSTSTKLTSKVQFRKPVKCGLSIAKTFFALLVCHVLQDVVTISDLNPRWAWDFYKIHCLRMDWWFPM